MFSGLPGAPVVLPSCHLWPCITLCVCVCVSMWREVPCMADSLCRVLCHSATVSWYRCESSKGIIKLKKGLKAGHVAVVWKSKGKAGRRRRSLVSDFLLKDDQFGRIRVASFFFCSFLQMFSFDRPRSLAAKKGRGINKKKKEKHKRKEIVQEADRRATGRRCVPRKGPRF